MQSYGNLILDILPFVPEGHVVRCDPRISECSASGCVGHPFVPGSSLQAEKEPESHCAGGREGKNFFRDLKHGTRMEETAEGSFLQIRENLWK